MLTLTRPAALRARWANQLLGGSDRTPVEVVDGAVALQGQDLAAVLTAIALRSEPGTTIDDVRAAFDRGDLVRSWPVRGTLFATTPAHLRDLLSLTRERIHRSTARRRVELGLDDAVLAAARDLVLPDLPLTRSEMLARWAAAGIDASGGRGYHLIFHHAVAGVWHWGAFRGGEQLLTATVAQPAAADPLPRLVRGLVQARGPMTTDDLAWWLKLPKADVRRALAEADVTEVAVDGAPAWIVDDVTDPGDTGVTFVPGFDEWILGYGNRSLTASAAMQRSLVPGNNGIFRPAVLVDGVTVGTWRGRTASRREPSFDLVEKVSASTRRRISAALSAVPHA